MNKRKKLANKKHRKSKARMKRLNVESLKLKRNIKPVVSPEEKKEMVETEKEVSKKTTAKKAVTKKAPAKKAATKKAPAKKAPAKKKTAKK